jgi:hypothetical protein
MADNLMASGKMASSMEKESLLLKTEREERENGIKENV